MSYVAAKPNLGTNRFSCRHNVILLSLLLAATWTMPPRAVLAELPTMYLPEDCERNYLDPLSRLVRQFAVPATEKEYGRLHSC